MFQDDPAMRAFFERVTAVDFEPRRRLREVRLCWRRSGDEQAFGSYWCPIAWRERLRALAQLQNARHGKGTFWLEYRDA